MKAPAALRVALTVALALTAVLGRAHAGDREEAKRLKDLASAALERGDYAGGLAGFEAAYRLFPSPNLRFNCGLAQVKLGRDVDAAESFTEFLGKSSDAPAEARHHAQEELDRLQSRLGHVVVDVTVAGAEVSVDGRTRSVAPLDGALWLAPGDHACAPPRRATSPPRSTSRSSLVSERACRWCRALTAAPPTSP